MKEYINLFNHNFKSYDFFINMGSIIGVVILLILFYRKSKSIKKSFCLLGISIVIVELGYFAGNAIRGLTYGGVQGMSDVIHLFTRWNGNHFIGRVLVLMWVFPVVYRLIYKKNRQEWIEYLDLLCIFMTFQHIFNRIACFFNGCCCGKYYIGKLAFQYKVEGKSGPGYSYSVYPTQFFEIACMVVLLIVLMILYIKNKRLVYVFQISFALTIFVSEFMMNSQGTITIWGFTVIQYCSGILLVTAFIMWLLRRREERNCVG